MTDNLKEHFDNCKQIATVVADANALLSRAADELRVARDVIETLLPYQHEKMTVETKYKSWTDKASMSAVEAARTGIHRLSKFLGDRA